MTYICNEAVSVRDLADLRESVGWNRMESEYRNPLLTSYTNIRLEMFRPNLVVESGAIPIVQRFCAKFFAIISDGD